MFAMQVERCCCLILDGERSEHLLQFSFVLGDSEQGDTRRIPPVAVRFHFQQSTQAGA